jgi:hypothetical protein
LGAAKAGGLKVKQKPLLAAGLIEVNARIPLTKSLHLEEAENLVRRPERGAAIFPFRAKLTPPSTHDKDGDLRQAHHKKLGNGRKGIVIPTHAPSLEKYGTRSMPLKIRRLLESCAVRNPFLAESPELLTTCMELLSSSLARNTWGKYAAAVTLWEEFSRSNKSKTEMLFQNCSLIAFCCWCCKEKDLAASTVALYCSALEKIKEWGKELGRGGKVLEKGLLKGVKNAKERDREKRKKTEPVVSVTVDLLRKIRRGLNGNLFPSLTSQSIWASCLTAFWGAFMVGGTFSNR